jgi:hypothetical protein
MILTERIAFVNHIFSLFSYIFAAREVYSGRERGGNRKMKKTRGTPFQFAANVLK